MLIGFQVDLTDLASPRRGTASSQGEGFCTGVSRAKEGAREEKRESGLKKKRGGGCFWVDVGGRGSGGVWKILPISMWKQKGSDRRSNPVKIDMVT